MSLEFKSLPNSGTLTLTANQIDKISLAGHSKSSIKAARVFNRTNGIIYWSENSMFDLNTADGSLAAGKPGVIDVPNGVWHLYFLATQSGNIDIEVNAEEFADITDWQALASEESLTEAITKLQSILETNQPPVELDYASATNANAIITKNAGGLQQFHLVGIWGSYNPTGPTGTITLELDLGAGFASRLVLRCVGSVRNFVPGVPIKVPAMSARVTLSGGGAGSEGLIAMASYFTLT